MGEHILEWPAVKPFATRLSQLGNVFRILQPL